MTTTNTPDPLAAIQFTALDGSAPGATPQADSPEDQATAQAMAMLEGNAVKLVTALFKVARALIARQLPEIKEEWPDAMLTEPAQAAIPLIKKHAARLMEVVSQSPELAAFVLSLLPLAFGAAAAMDKQTKRLAMAGTQTANPEDGHLDTTGHG